MALIQCNFFSEVLKVGTAMNVILPQPAGPTQIGLAGTQAPRPEHGYPTLYLLHGLSDDQTAWTRRTALERYASGRNLAIVMPRVDRSYYADMVHGPAYWTFVSEELPRLARSFFPLSARREDNFAAGLSMGGYGAFKLALAYPDRFAAAASLSGALDPVGLLEAMPDRSDEWIAMFGDPPHVAGTVSDLFHQARLLSSATHATLPLYQCCGTADFLYASNLRFRDHAQSLNLNLTYEEHPGGSHEWGYWDRMIQRVLEWLPLNSDT